MVKSPAATAKLAAMDSESGSEYETDRDAISDSEGLGAGPSKRPKLMKYKTSFSQEWKKTWPFLTSVPGKPHFFRCNVCDKKLSCAHQGVSDVKDHIATKSHQRLAKALETQPKLPFGRSSDPLQDKVSWLTLPFHVIVQCERQIVVYAFRLLEQR